MRIEDLQLRFPLTTTPFIFRGEKKTEMHSFGIEIKGPMVKCQQCACNGSYAIHEVKTCVCVCACCVVCLCRATHFGLLHDHKLCRCRTMVKTVAWVKNGLFKMYIKTMNRISQIAIYMERTFHFSYSALRPFLLTFHI